MNARGQYGCPRIVLSGLRGGAGKTVVTLGLIETWRRKGLIVAPFKKGPDYIDAAWLSLSAGRPCRNLDTFLMEKADILKSLRINCGGADIAVIEGNRGLYDGMDAEGTHSTAELAKLTATPVVLVVNCRKITRTAAALVLGCRMLDEGVKISGVVLNNLANARQETVIRKAVEGQAGVSVFGAVPRIKGLPFAERHLGLLPPPEHPDAGEVLDLLYEATVKNVDADAVRDLAVSSPGLPLESEERDDTVERKGASLRIGILKDSAFTFYYPDNLEALERLGAELVRVNSLRDGSLPELDALYIGGGFPETHARELAQNESFRSSLRRAAEDGLPIYAECGGIMFLGRALEYNGKTYPMAGVFPVAFSVRERPQGHGYVVVEADRRNPFFTPGTVLRGHEFHYGRVNSGCGEVKTAFNVRRGAGFDRGRDGLIYRNVLALFCHVHALGEKRWANALVEADLRRAASIKD